MLQLHSAKCSIKACSRPPPALKHCLEHGIFHVLMSCSADSPLTPTPQTSPHLCSSAAACRPRTRCCVLGWTPCREAWFPHCCCAGEVGAGLMAACVCADVSIRCKVSSPASSSDSSQAFGGKRQHAAMQEWQRHEGYRGKLLQLFIGSEHSLQIQREVF